MLIEALRSKPHLSQEEISLIFEKVQKIRMPRMSYIFGEAVKTRASQALETPELAKEFFSNIPKVTEGMLYQQLDAQFCPAVSLHTIPQPKRPWSVPYEDEYNHVHVKASL